MTTWMAHFAADNLKRNVEQYLDALLDAFPADTGAAIAGQDRAVEVTFTVEGTDAAQAFGAAHVTFRKALEAAGLDVWTPARGEVVRADIADAELDQPNTPDLVGLAELAEHLKVSKQRVGELRDREDFPRPLAILASGPVWDRRALTHFEQSWVRKPGRPSKAEVEARLDRSGPHAKYLVKRRAHPTLEVDLAGRDPVELIIAALAHGAPAVAGLGWTQLLDAADLDETARRIAKVAAVATGQPVPAEWLDLMPARDRDQPPLLASRPGSAPLSG